MTRASSPLTTARVASVARSRTSAFASAIASTEAKCPTCASPTLVHTRTSGSASSTSRLISPAWFIPNSTTATSGRLRSSSSVSGRPMWLFRFPTLRYTVCRVARNSAVASFVDVFPALPVMATTEAPDNRRMWCPSSCNAVSVSSTSIVTAPGGPGRRRAPRRPAPRALLRPTLASTNAAPSNRSPRNAMNNWPAPTRRESVVKPSNVALSSPLTTVPPTAAATSAAVSTMGALGAPPTLTPHAGACAGGPAHRARPPRRQTAALVRR